MSIIREICLIVDSLRNLFEKKLSKTNENRIYQIQL